jgi:hypothetical protein
MGAVAGEGRRTGDGVTILPACARMARVPLSDDEIRILQEIEKNFYDSDPAFAHEVGAATLTRSVQRAMRWAALAFVLGLVVLIVGFTRSVLLGFLGFAVMVGAGFTFYVNAAKLGRGSLPAVSSRTGNLGEAFERRSQRLRERFRRDDETE